MGDSKGSDLPSRQDGEAPVCFTGLSRTGPASKAGGLKAVANAMRHLKREGYSPLAGLRQLQRMNQKGGFDCPGCAWPDPDDRRSLLGEYCENGAKAFAEEATKKRCDAEFFARHSLQELLDFSDFELSQAGRLTQPMLLDAGASHYRPVHWGEVFEILAEELGQLDSPDEAIFYTSGRTSNEAAFLYQLFVRQLGTNNLPDCSNMCHESSGAGLGQTLGLGKGSVSLSDVETADLVVVVGQNPGTNHPRMLTALQAAKRNGAELVSVNPLREPGLVRFQHPQHLGELFSGGLDLCDQFLRVTVGGDVALFKSVLILLLEREEAAPGTVFDHEFIEEHCSGYAELLADLKSRDLEALIAASGVSRKDLEEFVERILRCPKMIISWAMGITQHRNGVDNIREIVNLLLLRGSIGKSGAGTCPVRGHSNVQGDRTVGIWERPKPEFLDKLGREFDFEPPREHGYSVVRAIEAMQRQEAKFFFAMGGNFLSASPDTAVTAAALRGCRLTAHVSTKLNRSHLVHGRRALILPCLARSERDVQASGVQFVSVENSMGIVHSSEGTRAPASEELRSEPWIVAALAKVALGSRSKVDWDGLVANYDAIRDKIEAVVPGFDEYKLRVRRPGGFLLPNGPRQRQWNTRIGKARLTINEPCDLVLAEGEYKLTTIRTHDQFNTTIYGLDDRYRGFYGERRVVMMNPEDMAAAGLSAEQRVDIHGQQDAAGRVAKSFLVVPYDIPRGCLASYFPEANVLVPLGTRARISETPASKLVIVSLAPASD
ncbi:MAG: hypothetical protein CSA62_10815 [Planctomycetota bacterium]|nr:MAG: hypothetical protein CSA62_10815 [Planctomycetota bacterium]